LELLGWNEVRLEKRRSCEDKESGSHIQFDMRFSNVHSRDKCPIPLFGSVSGGRIRILCLYGKYYAPDKLYHMVECDNEQLPVIILFFGVMSRMRRQELYNLALDRQASFLVVDDIVISTICERRESLMLRWLYILTVPFSVQTMYTSVLGVVHPEMFYGRVSAKKDLGINGSVCAVYGGRQLGKTALLKNIEYESHQPQDDHFVYYIQLSTTTVENPDYSLTKAVADKIRKDIPLSKKTYENVKELLEDIRDWLCKKATYRLLLLLDEADEFLLADSKSRFRVTGSINNLMTSTDMRFKVVFAGLHNVYRMISAPNHPLAHHGRPISIGPLLAGELQDAINLIRQPYEVMGYRFESLDVIIRILAETNYYPSLIQLFCMKLHEHLHLPEVWQQRRYILPVMITMKDIDTVLEDSELKKAICDRFMWTLELDDRYKAIALSIAFDAGQAVQADQINKIMEGYDLHWISSEMEKHSNLFSEHSSMDNLRGLCDELVQLGVLSNVSSDRYMLRTVNILNMLGTSESILTKLDELDRKKYDYNTMYNGMLYRKKFNDTRLGDRCYPLTNQQIHSVLDEGGLKLIMGNQALGLDLVETCLRELLGRDANKPVNYDLYQQKSYTIHTYHRKFPEWNELGDGRAVNLVCTGCEWDVKNLKRYGQKMNSISEQERPILIVLCDEIQSHQILVNSSVNIDFIPAIRLAVWDLEAVQFWLNESLNTPLLTEHIIKIMERLQGWPAAIYQLCELLAAQKEKLVFDTKILEQTVEALVQKQTLYELLPEKELEPLLQPICKIYAEYEDYISCKEIRDLLNEEGTEVDMEYVERVMAWMADLELLNRRPQKGYCMNSLVLELWKKLSADL